ncbi:hypothetical protein UNPF46_30630 [Bradyrhizobium sp. UNPF46]|uniref:SMODS domain-containing nucleotidyltransferase n=1 Tax=Bradyrhizobium sp. UNPF46 TaxID=1141168 RepID=UPI001172B4A2|nr:hypothetical protein [Bradyrhizobium sp. UNPF46]TQF27425.1 hypothetical protein UNPF46_30630 [Bradyrhizobium sp. UNPF46]
MGQPNEFVSRRFEQFLENIKLTVAQASDGETKHKNVRSCLNSRYYSSTSETANSRLIGSWGKSLRIRPPRDVDVLFQIPYETYQRFEQRTGNKQSQLLQEVRDVLKARFSSTDVKGDGPAVVVPFQSYKVELVPAVKLTSGQFWICITKDGGSYKTFDPDAELEKLRASDQRSNGNTRALIRMMKVWQAYCSVPLKSFHIELLAVNFLGQWANYDKSTVYYDWMVRDFFSYIKDKDWTYLYAPGTSESMLLDGSWKSRAESAHARAVKACENEAGGYNYLAGEEWQKIFGTDIPMGV